MLSESIREFLQLLFSCQAKSWRPEFPAYIASRLIESFQTGHWLLNHLHQLTFCLRNNRWNKRQGCQGWRCLRHVADREARSGVRSEFNHHNHNFLSCTGMLAHRRLSTRRTKRLINITHLNYELFMTCSSRQLYPFVDCVS